MLVLVRITHDGFFSYLQSICVYLIYLFSLYFVVSCNLIIHFFSSSFEPPSKIFSIWNTGSHVVWEAFGSQLFKACKHITRCWCTRVCEFKPQSIQPKCCKELSVLLLTNKNDPLVYTPTRHNRRWDRKPFGGAW